MSGVRATARKTTVATTLRRRASSETRRGTHECVMPQSFFSKAFRPRCGAGSFARSRLSGGSLGSYAPLRSLESPAESRLQPRMAAPQILQTRRVEKTLRHYETDARSANAPAFRRHGCSRLCGTPAGTPSAERIGPHQDKSALWCFLNTSLQPVVRSKCGRLIPPKRRASAACALK
jgi:hypothetical protein